MLTSVVKMLPKCPFCCVTVCAWFVRYVMKTIIPSSADVVQRKKNCTRTPSAELDLACLESEAIIMLQSGRSRDLCISVYTLHG